MTPVLDSVLTCPHCAQKSEQHMPEDACLFFWQCPHCRTVARPRPGDCCVFCSFGSVPCPSMQTSGGCRGNRS